MLTDVDRKANVNEEPSDDLDNETEETDVPHKIQMKALIVFTILQLSHPQVSEEK